MKKQLLLLVVILLTMAASAHDIEVSNGNGVTIYYNYTNDGTELEVTYRGEGVYSYENEYTGNVVIPEEVTYMNKTCKVTSIGYLAFFGCTEVTSVTIPVSVTSIEYAFYGCTGLTSVTIPSSVTSIAEHAFSGCTGLTSVTINSNSIVSKNYFYESYLLPSLQTIFGEQVRNYIIGDGVTSIGSAAFYGCTGLTSVTIPSSITSIGEYAFYGCTGLTSVTIPYSVTSIGKEAFIDTGLTSVTINSNSIMSLNYSLGSIFDDVKNYIIGNSVTCIGKHAFSGNRRLTSVTIPNSVTSIGDSAFYYCSSLTSVTIPNNVTSIKSSTFQACTSLTSITIPNSVTSIGESAFDGCSGLTSVTIPNSVTSIGESAFFKCSGLTSITIPNSVTSIGKSAFEFCSSLTFIIIGNSVTSIGVRAFDGCRSLTSVTIPNCVTSIGEYAFKDCHSLTSFTIPSSVTGIGEYAFYGCKGLTSVTIGNSLKCIGRGTFSGCYGLTSVTIGNSVTSIGEYAFYGCSNLNKVIISDIAAWCGVIFATYDDNPLSIAKHLYSDENMEIVDLVIPNGVTNIGASAFYGCSDLTSVTIPNSVTSIGKYAFYGCSNLNKVIVSDIAAWCGILFAYSYANPLCYAKHLYSDENTEIKDLVIPNSVTSIGESTFWDCRGLTSVTIPNSVTSIGEYAFYGCMELTSVTALNPTPVAIEQNVFTNRTNATLYVPKGSKEDYQIANYWKEFKEIKNIPLPTHKLIYMVDGEEYKSYDVEEGESIIPEEEPTKEGYTFSGWSDIPETMPAHDVTVTGTFSVNSYKLTYMLDDKVYKETMYEYGATIVPEPQPEGDYATFEWIDLPQTMPAHDVVVYASYTTGIIEVLMATQRNLRIYSPNGKKLNKLQKGLNILILDNGTIKKVVVK